MSGSASVNQPAGPTPRAKKIAERLDQLIQRTSDVHGKTISYAKLAEKINALAGKKVITDTTIWKLRTAQEDNPRTQTLEWLARGLGVRTGAYFTDDDVARAVDEQLELADAIAETFANDRRLGLLQRADGLSAKSLAALIQMADTFRDLEHLDDEEPPRTSARP